MGKLKDRSVKDFMRGIFTHAYTPSLLIFCVNISSCHLFELPQLIETQQMSTVERLDAIQMCIHKLKETGCNTSMKSFDCELIGYVL